MMIGKNDLRICHPFLIANDLDPYRYLVYIFDEAPKMAAKDEDWVTAVLPENSPDFCKAGKN